MKTYNIAIISVIICSGCISSYQSEGIEPLAKEDCKYSYVASSSSLPLSFHYKELTSRKWKNDSGETIVLLAINFFKIKTEGFPNVICMKYGNPKSREIECIDFYATSSESKEGAKNHLLHLLCHDLDCPPIKTKVTLEENAGRVHFRVDGSFIDNKKKKLKHYRYTYELNPKWQMIEGLSHFTWDEKLN